MSHEFNGTGNELTVRAPIGYDYPFTIVAWIRFPAPRGRLQKMIELFRQLLS